MRKAIVLILVLASVCLFAASPAAARIWTCDDDLIKASDGSVYHVTPLRNLPQYVPLAVSFALHQRSVRSRALIRSYFSDISTISSFPRHFLDFFQAVPKQCSSPAFAPFSSSSFFSLTSRISWTYPQPWHHPIVLTAEVCKSGFGATWLGLEPQPANGGIIVRYSNTSLLLSCDFPELVATYTNIVGPAPYNAKSRYACAKNGDKQFYIQNDCSHISPSLGSDDFYDFSAVATKSVFRSQLPGNPSFQAAHHCSV